MEYGLSTADVIAQQKKYGKNTISVDSGGCRVIKKVSQFVRLISGMFRFLLVISSIAFSLSLSFS